MELIETYDVSQINIGSIRFAEKATRMLKGWHVGYSETDLLLINLTTGEIEIEECPSDGRILWHCAENGGKFLDAFLIAARFLGQCSWNIPLYEDQSAHHRVAAECAVAAGGDRYRDFYLVLCGCD